MKKKVKQSLCIVYKNPEILLGMKKRGFGIGKWNGFGGKIRSDEKIEVAARRELKEEAGLTAVEIEKVGVINFKFEGKSEAPEVHFFWVKKWSGAPVESEEMRPAWFHINDIPLDKMWPDDKYWLPIFLDNKKFKGKFIFAKDGKIIDYKLKQYQDLAGEKAD